MKWNCELIQDLLPLYEEGLASPASAGAVREHLAECDACRRLAAPLPIEVPQEPPAADQAVKKSMKKVRRRWLASLLAALLAVPLLLLSVNQYRGIGLCFTNLDDLYTARRYLHALETRNWDKAAGMYSYEGDYESILDALSMEVADWGHQFVPVDLFGHTYMASTWMESLLPADIGELYGLLYNQQISAMIPLALWQELMTIDPSAFQQNGWQYWLGEQLYGKIITPWGEFVVTDGWGYNTAAEYCDHFDLIPAAVYEEAKPELDAEARQHWEATHAAYDYVAQMTRTEFLAYMERSYAADLRSMEGQVTFDCTGLHSAYRVFEDDGWKISLAVTLTYGTETLDVWMDLDVENGKVCTASLSYREPAPWLSELEAILYPSAHPNY